MISFDHAVIPATLTVIAALMALEVISTVDDKITLRGAWWHLGGVVIGGIGLCLGAGPMPPAIAFAAIAGNAVLAGINAARTA